MHQHPKTMHPLFPKRHVLFQPKPIRAFPLVMTEPQDYH